MADKKVIELLDSGGEANAGPPLGRALGPLGINIGAIGNNINEITKEYAGLKGSCQELFCHRIQILRNNRWYTHASALIAAEFKVEKGSGNPTPVKIGNLTMEQIVSIAKIKGPELLSPTLKKVS